MQMLYGKVRAAFGSIGSGMAGSANTSAFEDCLNVAGMHWTDTDINPPPALRNGTRRAIIGRSLLGTDASATRSAQTERDLPVSGGWRSATDSPTTARRIPVRRTNRSIIRFIAGVDHGLCDRCAD